MYVPTLCIHCFVVIVAIVILVCVCVRVFVDYTCIDQSIHAFCISLYTFVYLNAFQSKMKNLNCDFHMMLKNM